MAQASVSRQSIQEAITELEAQLPRLGQDERLIRAIEAVGNVLSQALAEDDPPDLQHVVALIADLSGYTTIAERMDAEQVREAMNAMWLELDGVIAAWGGRVDQHAGDSLVALFGLPWSRELDTWRAVQAAQALQLELSSFNDRVRQQAGESGHAQWLEHWTGPQMRIGLHEGPLGVTNDPYGKTLIAAGDTLHVAYDLEDAAPPGAILASSEVQQHVQDSFWLEHPKPRRSRQPSYLVGAPKPQEPPWKPGAVGDIVPRFIGRIELIEELESAFLRAADARNLEILTLIGETGMGKTRLLHEFLPRLQILAPGARVLRAHIHECMASRPYALFRDLLMRYLNIYPSHSLHAVQAIIAASQLPENLPGDRQASMETLEELLLVQDGPVRATLAEVTNLARSLMVQAAGDGALVVVFDDLHFADDYSLACLIICYKLL
ncbi:MAG: adenylate/guanylate cyclase domain-containing protein [Chloroflexota bacterium]